MNTLDWIREKMPDDKFLIKVKEIILDNLEDDSFGVANLAHKMGLSRSQLFRKLKSNTNYSANQLIRNIRLEEACKLLTENTYTVSEVAFKVGFSSPSYFNKCFHDQYGCAPGDYVKTKAEQAIPTENPFQKSLRPVLKIGIPAVMILSVILLLSLIRNNSNTSVNAASVNDLSIAVMPLLDLSENKQREHIAVGLTDAIILELSKIKNLRVISRGSAMLFRDSVLPYSDIANQLGVNLLLEGSIVYNGDSMRVTVQLIEPFPEEKHLWANKYVQSATNVINLSNDISSAIANEIELVFDDTKNHHRLNPKVYDLYLKAHHLWLTQRPQSLKDAIGYLEQSMAIDSGYAPAYSLLAECYISLNKFIRNNDEKLKNRKNGRAAIDKALDKAIELDGSLAEAYITKGNILGKFDYNWEGMKKMVEKGLQLNPNNSAGYIALYYYYSVKGELDQCIAMAHKAEELDPLNPRTLSTVANAYVLAGRYDEAIEQYKNALQLFSDYGFAWDGLGYAYYMLGDTTKAIEAWSELHRIIGNTELVKYYQTESFKNSIRFWLNKTTTGEKMYCSNPSIIAMVHLFVDDPEGAMDYLEFAYQYKHLDLPFLIIRPNFRSLYNHPRFNEIAQKVGVNLDAYKKINF